jgi:hypothetical protein
MASSLNAYRGGIPFRAACCRHAICAAEQREHADDSRKGQMLRNSDSSFAIVRKIID